MSDNKHKSHRMHPNSLANLAKGRGGAPRKGMSWRELILAIGDEEVAETGMTRKELTIRRAYQHAANGNAQILVALLRQSEPIPAEVMIHHDWRDEARAAGLSEAEVLAEAERIIQQAQDESGDSASDSQP